MSRIEESHRFIIPGKPSMHCLLPMPTNQSRRCKATDCSPNYYLNHQQEHGVNPSFSMAYQPVNTHSPSESQMRSDKEIPSDSQTWNKIVTPQLGAPWEPSTSQILYHHPKKNRNNRSRLIYRAAKNATHSRNIVGETYRARRGEVKCCLSSARSGQFLKNVNGESRTK